MSEIENEMTLTQFFKIIGKSWKKFVIYALSAVIFATAVMSLVNVFADTRHAYSTITVDTADDNALNALTSKKNEALTTAVSEMFASAPEKQQKIISALSPNLTVTAPSDDEKSNGVSAVQYVVDIEEDKSLGLSANQYKALTDSVARKLVKNLTSVGKLDRLTAFDYDIDKSIAGLEYIQVAYDVTGMLEDMRDVVNASYSAITARTPAASEFKGSNGRSIKEILAALDAYVSAAERTADTIVTLKLGNKNAAVSAKDYLKNAYDAALITAKRYSDFAAETDKELQYYKDLKITMSATEKDSVIVQDFAKIYNELTLRNETAQKNAALANEAASLLEMRYNVYKDLTADQINESTETDGVTTKLKTVYESAVSLVEEYNLVATEYENSSYVAYTSRVSGSKISVSRVFSFKVQLIVDAAILLVSLIAAYTRTFEKFKRDKINQ